MTQWDLSTMTLKMRYNLVGYKHNESIVINKNQTLLAINFNFIELSMETTNVFSMETGMLVSSYAEG